MKDLRHDLSFEFEFVEGSVLLRNTDILTVLKDSLVLTRNSLNMVFSINTGETRCVQNFSVSLTESES